MCPSGATCLSVDCCFSDLALYKVNLIVMCLAEIEDEFHFTVKCTSLYVVRDKLYDEISAIIPSFVNMTDESKFKFMYTYSEYDVIRVIVKGINDMYNARNELLNNK